MKLIVKAGGILLLIFLCIFIFMTASGILSKAFLLDLLHTIQQMATWKVVLCIIALLVVDLIITVPTMSTVVVAGYVLGAVGGGLAATIGLLLSGSIGYFLSRKYGEKLLRRLTKDPEEIKEMNLHFQQHGNIVLVLCRGLPMLPEVSSCLAGMSRMPFGKYLLWYAVGSVPYAFTAAYIGSISSVRNPETAIIGMLSISFTLWAGWFFYRKFYSRVRNT